MLRPTCSTRRPTMSLPVSKYYGASAPTMTATKAPTRACRPVSNGRSPATISGTGSTSPIAPGLIAGAQPVADLNEERRFALRHARAQAQLMGDLGTGRLGDDPASVD